MKTENWKPILGFEDKYEVSDLGRIKSLHKRNPGIILNPRIDRAGYYSIRLSKQGSTFTYFVHRLVAMHFIPNVGNKPQVNHISCNKLDNSISNLEWVTHSENILHAYKMGACKNTKRFKGKEVIDECTGIIYPSILSAVKATKMSYSEFNRKIHGFVHNDTCFQLAA